MQFNMQAPFPGLPSGAMEDLYANDICRTLSIIGAATSEDVIAHLRGLNLGDDFWMFSFKVFLPHGSIWTSSTLFPAPMLACVGASARPTASGDSCLSPSRQVVPCAKTFSHKWTLCPCGHAGEFGAVCVSFAPGACLITRCFTGETARRRDPRLHPYRAVLCPLVKAVGSLLAIQIWIRSVRSIYSHLARAEEGLSSWGQLPLEPQRI